MIDRKYAKQMRALGFALELALMRELRVSLALIFAFLLPALLACVPLRVCICKMLARSHDPTTH
jgi:hypothetical protein